MADPVASADPAGCSDPIPPTIEWRGDEIALIDQRALPGELRMLTVRSVEQLCDAIATLAVRGAPALGAAGAMGVALAVATGADPQQAGARLVATRPTAVNLAWGVRRALAAADPAAEAVAIAAEDVAINQAMGAIGAPLLSGLDHVLTHCNSGSLAAVGWGTALGVIRSAWQRGAGPHVWVDETRPLLQGARLTAWELGRLAIPHTLVADVMAGSLMAAGRVGAVVVGADRIAANGDVANKVGTYPLAVLAAYHRVPFYVVAPTSTFDPSTPDGASIPVEERAAEEVTVLGGRRIAPEGVAVANAAFDVTPAALVSAYVTEREVRQGARANRVTPLA